MASKEFFNDNTTAENELPVSVQECINNIIKKEGYETHKVDFKLVNTEGANYLGYLYEIDIRGKTIDGEKETNLFVKVSKTVDHLDGILSIHEAYLAEGYFYKVLSKIFEELEENAMVPLEERLNMVRCYEQTDENAIILENLTKKGYKTLYRMDVPSLKFVELCTKEIAKFHAFSYVIQKRDPEYFIEKLASRKSVLEFSSKFDATILNLAGMVIKYCDGDIKKKLEDFLPVYVKKLSQYYQDQKSTICCLCHGDFRLSNILTRETEGEIEKVILIDFQLIQYGCPVNDFLYFIYTCTDREFRSLHLEHIKNVYHNTMSRFLQYFDIDAEEVYPRKEFERVLGDKKDLGLIFALYLYAVVFVPESEAPDLSQDDLCVVDLAVNQRGQKRFLEIVEELWG